MARDVADDSYYISSGGKIPVKWTAPEVCSYICIKYSSIHLSWLLLCKIISYIQNYLCCYYSSFNIFVQALFYKKYSVKSDVWSFGCVMYEIWSLGLRPFKDCSGAEVHS